MRTITCDKCGKTLTDERSSPSMSIDVHVISMVLENAAALAPKQHTRKQGDFCHGCAANLFRTFDEPLPRAMEKAS